jgi:hypothetical protein
VTTVTADAPNVKLRGSIPRGGATLGKPLIYYSYWKVDNKKRFATYRTKEWYFVKLTKMSIEAAREWEQHLTYKQFPIEAIKELHTIFEDKLKTKF